MNGVRMQDCLIHDSARLMQRALRIYVGLRVLAKCRPKGIAFYHSVNSVSELVDAVWLNQQSSHLIQHNVWNAAIISRDNGHSGCLRF